MDATVYYNPKCGTCRKVVEGLHQRGIKTHLIEYLKCAPSAAELDGILKKLGETWEDAIRKKEPVYAEKFSEKNIAREAWPQLLHENPVLIQRPIVVVGDRAAVIRPPEKLSEFLD